MIILIIRYKRMLHCCVLVVVVGFEFPNPTSGVSELGNNFQYPIIVNTAVDTVKNDDTIIIHTPYCRLSFLHSTPTFTTPITTDFPGSNGSRLDFYHGQDWSIMSKDQQW
jgi:hypothetical protein